MANPSQSPISPPRRSAITVGNFLRLAGGFAALALLYYLGIIDLAGLGALANRPEVLALALAAMLANIPLEALRWHILLRCQGLSLPFGATLRVQAASVFFVNFLPGAAGGDLIRGIYLYRATKGRRTSALLSLIIDRLIGFIAYISLGLAALLALPSTQAIGLERAIISLSVLVVAALIAFFFFGHPIERFLHRILPARAAHLGTIVEEVGMALRQYARDWRSIGLALLISITMMALTVASIVLIAEAMHFGKLSVLEYGVASLYAVIGNSLPLTPGGIGVGEAVFDSLCVMLAPHGEYVAYGTIFLAFRCIFILSTLPGVLIYSIKKQ